MSGFAGIKMPVLSVSLANDAGLVRPARLLEILSVLDETPVSLYRMRGECDRVSFGWFTNSRTCFSLVWHDHSQWRPVKTRQLLPGHASRSQIARV
jgi:hypothetical protein